ncbi:hypothetical protein ABT033_31445 [Streptomyces pharetrae]|uniref:hypothetical protein n=1 Tax=Streptomyces pharetrae TaxID=291370 RepID=UPI003358056D
MMRPEPAVRPEDIRLSYTDPVTGRVRARDWGEQYVVINGVVLVVKHIYRARSGQCWEADAYTDHLETMPMVEWAKAGGHFGFVHVRRRLLLEQIAREVGTQEWQQKKAAWLAVPRSRRVSRRYRVEWRGPGEWWAVPAYPQRDRERGPFASREAALAELGDSAA